MVPINQNHNSIKNGFPFLVLEACHIFRDCKNAEVAVIFPNLDCSIESMDLLKAFSWNNLLPLSNASTRFFKWIIHGLVFVFSLFKQMIQNFYNKWLWKMSFQNPTPGFELLTFKNDSPPLTTRLGLNKILIKDLTVILDRNNFNRTLWSLYSRAI